MGALDEPRGHAYLVSTSTDPSLCRIELSTMTLDRCIDLGPVGSVLDIHVDSTRGFVYVLTKSSNLLRIPTAGVLASASIQTLSLASRGSVLSAAFETSGSNLLLTAVSSSPDALLVQVDLQTFTVSNAFNLSIPNFSAPRTAAVDAIHGFAYFVSFSNPAVIAKINLKTLNLDDIYISLGAQSRATAVTLGDDSRSLFVADFSNLFVVTAPSPCQQFCSGRGTCQYGGDCLCDAGWQDVDCTARGCTNGTDPTPGATNTGLQQCSGVGICNNGTCQCFAGYSGSSCSIFECPKSCSGRGTCDSQSHVCSCDVGYNGTGCELRLEYLPCDQSQNCDECGRNPQCVWCASSNKCTSGGIQGPYIDYCSDWHHRTCPQVAFTAVASVLTIIWAVLFLINVVSALLEDFSDRSSRAKIAERSRSAWWRELRSHDSWRIAETFQYLGLFSALNASGLPTYFLQYSRVFQWAIVAARPIWESPYIFAVKPIILKRSLLSWNQVAHTTGTHPAYLVIGCLIVWAIITAIIAIVRVILQFTTGKESPLRDRCIHAIVRVALFFQIPLTAFGAAAILYSAKNSSNWVGLAIGIIMLLVWIAVPVAVIIVLKRAPAKTILAPANKLRWGSLIVPYNFRKTWFAGLPLMKKTLIALIFGFLASESAPACLGLSIAITIGYAIFCIVSQVFVEFSSLLLELVTSALEVVMWALCFGLIQIDPSSAFSIIIAVLHSAAVLVGALTYVIHWLRYANVHSVGQLLKKEEK
jgi:hypothetical protein